MALATKRCNTEKWNLLKEIMAQAADLPLENQIVVLTLAKAMQDTHSCMNEQTKDTGGQYGSC